VPFFCIPFLPLLNKYINYCPQCKLVNELQGSNIANAQVGEQANSQKAANAINDVVA